jgi:hypothetical protein
MSCSTQTRRHNERGAVAGLRLLGIGVLLLAVAAVAINQFNPDKKPATPTTTTTTTASTTTSTTASTTTSTPRSMETLKCDSNKFALVATPASPGILPTDLQEKVEKKGKQALIVSPQLCDTGREGREDPGSLIFIGPFATSDEACEFKTWISSQQSPKTTTTTTTTTTQAPSKDSLASGDSGESQSSSGQSSTEDPLASGDSGESQSSSGQSSTESPPPPDWEVHNIRNLRDDSQSCEGN